MKAYSIEYDTIPYPKYRDHFNFTFNFLVHFSSISSISLHFSDLPSAKSQSSSSSSQWKTLGTPQSHLRALVVYTISQQQQLHNAGDISQMNPYYRTKNWNCVALSDLHNKSYIVLVVSLSDTGWFHIARLRLRSGAYPCCPGSLPRRVWVHFRDHRNT